MKQEELANLSIEWKRGSGLSKSDLDEDGKYKCILYGELYTKHKNVLIESCNISKTNKIGVVCSKKGDILVPGTSTASKKDMLLAREIDEDGVFLGGDINIIRPSQGIFAKKYLPYYFETFTAYDQLDRYITGATGIIHISNSGIKKLKVPLFLIPEQQRIVSILDEVFAAIDKVKANAERNLQNAKELFESELTVSFKKKASWKEKTLNELCEISSKLIDPKLDEYQNLIHIGAGNIEIKSGLLSNLLTAKEENLISGKFLFDESMVLYSKIRPYLMKVVRCNFKGLCSADIYPLVPIKNEMIKDYLYYLLLTNDFTEYAILGSQRAGMPKVNREHLFAYKLYIPPVTEQQTIVEHLDVLSARCKVLEINYQKTIAQCDEMKKAVLAKAFNGEL